MIGTHIITFLTLFQILCIFYDEDDYKDSDDDDNDDELEENNEVQN